MQRSPMDSNVLGRLPCVHSFSLHINFILSYHRRAGDLAAKASPPHTHCTATPTEMGRSYFLRSRLKTPGDWDGAHHRAGQLWPGNGAMLHRHGHWRTSSGHWDRFQKRGTLGTKQPFSEGPSYTGHSRAPVSPYMTYQQQGRSCPKKTREHLASSLVLFEVHTLCRLLLVTYCSLSFNY